MKHSERERFFSKIDYCQPDCWLWLGTLHPSGRPAFKLGNGNNISALRYAWLESHTGESPPRFIVSLCANKLCVNPAHAREAEHPGAAVEYEPVKARFETKVNKTDFCWLWTGLLHPKGYGYIKDRGKNIKVHRLAYELYIGPIPEGMLVCHTCDVRNCVNPEHLWLGTNDDNIRDMRLKGRADRVL